MNDFLFNPKTPNDGSIKRFESKYEISLNSFIKILIALNLEQDLENLFTQKNYNSIDEVING